MKTAFKILLLTPALAVTAKGVNELSFLVARRLYGPLSAIDPDSAWLVLTVHHIVQAVIAIGLITAWGRMRKLRFEDFGFRKGRFRESLRPVFLFSLFWAILQFGFGLVHVYVLNRPFFLNYRIGVFNAAGYFLFQVLLSGTSEEILFRALILTVVLTVLGGDFDKPARAVIVASAISTLVFMFDHVGISLAPFRITHWNPWQQITCLIFAPFYCLMYFRYRNVYSAMVAHNLLNGVITVVSLIVFVSYPIPLLTGPAG